MKKRKFTFSSMTLAHTVEGTIEFTNVINACNSTETADIIWEDITFDPREYNLDQINDIIKPYDTGWATWDFQAGIEMYELTMRLPSDAPFMDTLKTYLAITK